MLSARIVVVASRRVPAVACFAFRSIIAESSQLRSFFSTNVLTPRNRVFTADFLKNGQQNFQKQRQIRTRQFSSKPETNEKTSEVTGQPKTPEPIEASVQPANLTFHQRFKAAYRQYGKVLIGVHLVLSTGWLGSFYLVASSGVDVAGLLEKWGISNEKISMALRSSVGNVAIAYLLYKLASPVRYAMTLGGTHIAVKQLRRLGYLRTPDYSKFAKKVK